MSRRKSILVLVVVALIIAGVFIFLNFKKAVAPQAPTSSNQSTVAGTENWKTYRSEGYGFEVKYPQNFYVTSETIEVAPEGGPQFVVVFSKYEVPPPREYVGIGVKVKNFSGDFKKHIDELIKAGVGSNEFYDCTTSITDVSKKEIRIDNVSGFEIKGFCGIYSDDYYVVRGTKLFTISSSGAEDEDAAIFSNFISTFKFTTENTTNWKTYRYGVRGFEGFDFRYPPDWRVREDFYRTPAQEAEGVAPSFVGLTLFSPNAVLEKDAIIFDGRQFECSVHGGTRCIQVKGSQIHTNSTNMEVLRVFDLLVSTIR